MKGKHQHGSSDGRPFLVQRKTCNFYDGVFRPGASAAPASRSRFRFHNRMIIGQKPTSKGPPQKYIDSLVKCYGSQLHKVDLGRDVLGLRNDNNNDDDKEESYRTAYLRRGRLLLEQAPLDLTFEQATRTKEFQALTAAYEIMTTPSWKKYYFETYAGLQQSNSIESPHVGDRTTTRTTAMLLPPAEDRSDNEDVGTPTRKSTLLKRCSSWGSGIVVKKESASPFSVRGGGGINKTLSFDQQVLRWNDQVTESKTNHSQPSCAVAVSPSSVGIHVTTTVLSDGTADDKDFTTEETKQNCSRSLSSEADDTPSIVVAKEFYKEMTRPLDSSLPQQQRKSPKSKYLRAKRLKPQLDYDDIAIKDAAVRALMTEIPLSSAAWDETIRENHDHHNNNNHGTLTVIDLGTSRSLTQEEAVNMSTEATTRGYVRIERLDDATTTTPSSAAGLLETSTVTFHSQGSDHHPDPKNTEIPPTTTTPTSCSIYQMLGLSSVTAVHQTKRHIVGDGPDLEFLTALDGYVKKVADGMEGLGRHFTICELSPTAQQVLMETFTLPDDDDVGGMLHVLSVENKQCEGIL